MIGHLNHIAIAVPDLTIACALYGSTLGASLSEPQDLPDHGVTIVFVSLPNTKIELMTPLGEASPIEKFLQKNPKGGLHHVCYEVDDIHHAVQTLTAQGLRVLGAPKPGAHGTPVIFLHPSDGCGTLIELEQAKS